MKWRHVLCGNVSHRFYATRGSQGVLVMKGGYDNNSVSSVAGMNCEWSLGQLFICNCLQYVWFTAYRSYCPTRTRAEFIQITFWNSRPIIHYHTHKKFINFFRHSESRLAFETFKVSCTVDQVVATVGYCKESPQPLIPSSSSSVTIHALLPHNPSPRPPLIIPSIFPA